MANPSDAVDEVQGALASVVAGGSLPSANTAPGRDLQRARRMEAVSLRLAGLTYAQIAERFEVSETRAKEMVQQTLSRAENLVVEEMRAVENARLDRAQAAIWTRVLNGDLKAIDAFLRISQRRARLNGLDAPTTLNLSVSVKQEMEEALAGLEALVLSEKIIDAEVVSDDDSDSDE